MRRGARRARLLRGSTGNFARGLAHHGSEKLAAASEERCDACPSPLASGTISPSPEFDSGLPRRVSSSPETNSGFPRRVSPSPETNSGFPRRVSPSPETDSGFPRRVSSSPEIDSGFPRRVSPSPETTSGFPRRASSPPEISPSFARRVSPSPETTREFPRHVSPPPETDPRFPRPDSRLECSDFHHLGRVSPDRVSVCRRGRMSEAPPGRFLQMGLPHRLLGPRNSYTRAGSGFEV